MYVFDAFELDPRVGELRHGGEPVKAEAMVTRLLSALARRGEGVLVTKDELVEEVWEGRALADNAITVCVARLRKVLRSHGGPRHYIATVYGKGYRFMRPVMRVASTSTGSTLPPAPISEVSEEAPCVGRERVLARLQRLHELVQAEHGRVCVVMGEAGIGKTKVIETFAQRLGGAGRVVWAYCRDSGTAPPLSPWIRLLRTAAAGAWSADWTRELGPHAARVRAWLGEAEGKAPDDTGDRGSEGRHATYDAVLRALTLLARDEPLCLVLDDLQWADAASLELLDMALDEIAQTRMLLLCTMRKLPSGDVQRPQTQLPSILGHRNCERLPLTRLTKVDVAAYLQARLPEDERSLAEEVFRHSEGVPFFMVELVRQLETWDGDRHRPLAVPGAALELFRGRVSKLSESAQQVLQAASVIGRAFELPILEVVCERSGPDTLAGLDEAIEHDIVVAASGTSSAFEFGHELMRRAIYDALPASIRRRMHLRVAQVVEQRGDVGDDVVHELAHHLHAALPEGDPHKAVEYCERAAHIAGSAYANSDAVSFLRHALEALDRVGEPCTCERARLHMTKVLFSRGQPGYRESLEAVHRFGKQLRDGPMLTLAACMYHPHPALKPIGPGVEQVLEHALAFLPPERLGARGAVLAVGACHAPACYDRRVVQARLSEAESLAREEGDPIPLYPVLLATLHLTGGQRERGRRRALRDELIELAHHNPYGMRVLPIDLAIDQALEEAQHGRLPEAGAALRRAARLSRAINHRELWWHVARLQAWARLDQADPGQGDVSELLRLHGRAERHEVLGLETFCAFDRCMLRSEEGAPVVHLDDEDLWALRFEPSDPVHIWAMKIRALAAAGLLQEAREALHAVPAAKLEALPDDGQLVGSLAQLGRAAIALSEHDHAAAVAARLSEVPAPYAINIGYRSEGAVAAVLGELLAFLNQPEAARAQLERGLSLNERAGLARCAPQTRSALACLSSN